MAGVTGSDLGSGLLAYLVELGFNPALAVSFLPTQNLTDHGSLAGFLQHLRAVAYLLA
jgi:hypothetical protein